MKLTDYGFSVKKTTILTCSLVLYIFVVAACIEPAFRNNKSEIMKDDQKCLEVAKNYLVEKYQYDPHDYEITYQGIDSSFNSHKVHLIHKEDYEPVNQYPGGGGGKSFVLLIHLETFEVMNQLIFQ